MLYLFYMDPKLQEQLNEQEVKIEQIFQSVKKIENYLKWTFWATVLVVVLPAVLLIFAIPSFISTFTSLSTLPL